MCLSLHLISNSPVENLARFLIDLRVPCVLVYTVLIEKSLLLALFSPVEQEVGAVGAQLLELPINLLNLFCA